MTPAERVKRHRIREARGDIFAQIDIPATLAVMLMDMGYLTEREALTQPRRRGEALIAFIQATLATRRKL